MATKDSTMTKQTEEPDTGVPDPGPDPWPEGHTPSEVAEEQRLKAEANKEKVAKAQEASAREANEASQPSHRVAAADLSGKE